MSKKLIDAQTAAATGVFTLDRPDEGPVMLSQSGLAGAETVDLQISQDNGSTWIGVTESGSAVQLTLTNTTLQVAAPGIYRVNKGATGGAVTVALHSRGNP